MEITIGRMEKVERMDGGKTERGARTFEDLFVWQKAHEFTLLTYKFTKKFPKNERFGLTSQFRKAAVSIAANMVEGYKRRNAQEKLRFFNMSQGLLEECRYYIILAADLRYIDAKQATEMKDLIEHVSRLLNSYCNSITSNHRNIEK